MAERLAYLWPEISLFVATCFVMVMGLSPKAGVRAMLPWMSAAAMAVAGSLAYFTTPVGEDAQGLIPEMTLFAKVLIAGVGLLLCGLLGGTVDRGEESLIARGAIPFQALRATRGEFWAFFLFSMTGLMLCASADDLIWLFLALELTSLPTYIMVTISTSGTRSQESGVKYFFLGALGAAIFLYGFAMLYGGTGTTSLSEMQLVIEGQILGRGLSPIVLLGLLISFIGLCFKIAAVPMHAYTADVYQGAASPVAAMLGFVPKAAGFIAIILLFTTVGWAGVPDADGNMVSGLPDTLRVTVWAVAALTMTVGNVLATLQTSAKRLLAYSSIAHSGYMLVGILAGPGDTFQTNGIAAALFYLACYGVMNTGAFAVIASLERRARTDAQARAQHDDPDLIQEVDEVSEMRGLCASRPLLGWTFVICVLSLLGFPPLVGFWGKLPLFTAGISAGELALVVILGLNSAIAAFYYLRLVSSVMFEPKPDEEEAPVLTPANGRIFAGAFAALAVVVLSVAADPLMRWAGWASGMETDEAPGVVDGNVVDEAELGG